MGVIHFNDTMHSLWMDANVCSRFFLLFCLYLYCRWRSRYYKNDSGRRGRDRMLVGFATTCANSAYHH